jgi:hypothetical protein
MAFQMTKRLDEVKKAHAQAYSEKVNKDHYTHVIDEKPHKFAIVGDDATFRPKMWDSLVTDCAFYYDNPTLK